MSLYVRRGVQGFSNFDAESLLTYAGSRVQRNVALGIGAAVTTQCDRLAAAMTGASLPFGRPKGFTVSSDSNARIH